MTRATTTMTLGKIAGRVALASTVVARAAAHARTFYAEQEAIDFCGEAVESLGMPDWLDSWLPIEDLRSLGLGADLKRADYLATVGVDTHTDDINGLTVCVVLHNDGLQFQQGRQRFRPAAGDWFFFDDAKKHAVHSKEDTTTLLCVTVPVAPI
jgi:hypothetical protein